MKIIEYVIRSPAGIHARNAWLLSRVAVQFCSTISVKKDDRIENIKNIMPLMTMRIKCGDAVSFIIDGEDESDAMAAVREFCEGNL